MSFSLSFVVAIASNVLVLIRSPFALPPPPLSIPLCCYLLPTLWHQNLLRQATANAVPSRALATPACLCMCVCVCGVCACWHAADTVTFTVLPNVFVACLFVRPAACLLPSLSVSLSLLRCTFRSVSCLVLSPVGLLPRQPSTPCIPLCLSGYNKCLTAAKSTATSTSTSTPTPTAITIPMPMSILIPIPFDLALEELMPLCII